MAAGFGGPLTHLAATSGTLSDPATHFGMVRLGAGLVGIDPSETTELHGASRLTEPIVHSATAKAGTPVGYGVTLAREAGQLGEVLRTAAHYDDRILIEHVVHGREIDVAVLREAGGSRWAPPSLEIHAAC